MQTIALVQPTAPIKMAMLAQQSLRLLHWPANNMPTLPPQVSVVCDHQQSLNAICDTIEDLRDIFPFTKIIAVSAAFNSHKAAAYYTAGADFYLTEQVCVSALSYILNALSKLHRQIEPKVVSLPPIELHLHSGQVTILEQKIQLRKRETQILACLLRHNARTVSRSQLVDYVWQKEFVPAYSTLDVYVRRLRIKLGKYKSCIETVRGFGYRANVAKLVG